MRRSSEVVWDISHELCTTDAFMANNSFHFICPTFWCYKFFPQKENSNRFEVDSCSCGLRWNFNICINKSFNQSDMRLMIFFNPAQRHEMETFISSFSFFMPLDQFASFSSPFDRKKKQWNVTTVTLWYVWFWISASFFLWFLLFQTGYSFYVVVENIQTSPLI